MEAAPVHLACFADDLAEANQDDPVSRQLASQNIIVREKPQWKAGIEALLSGKPVSLTSFENAQMSSVVDHIVAENDIDCIFVFSGQMAQYVPAEFSGRFIMDFADVDSVKFETYGLEGAGPMALINRREGVLLANFEKQIGARANQSLFVSEAEAKLFQQRSDLPADKISAVGNGIDLEFYDPEKVVPIEKPTLGPLLVFTGQMDYRPNVEAVQSFSNAVMPQILSKHPEARFAIVGRAPTEGVKVLDGNNGTIVSGAVPDIRQWLKSADMVVAPLRIARGIQNKVLEAMAMQKAVVASTAAAEGIDAENGRHFLVAQDIADEARLIDGLLHNRSRARQIGEAAKQLIHKRYSWNNQLSDLHSICGLNSEKFLEAAE